MKPSQPDKNVSPTMNTRKSQGIRFLWYGWFVKLRGGEEASHLAHNQKSRVQFPTALFYKISIMPVMV